MDNHQITKASSAATGPICAICLASIAEQEIKAKGRLAHATKVKKKASTKPNKKAVKKAKAKKTALSTFEIDEEWQFPLFLPIKWDDLSFTARSSGQLVVGQSNVMACRVVSSPCFASIFAKNRNIPVINSLWS